MTAPTQRRIEDAGRRARSARSARPALASRLLRLVPYVVMSLVAAYFVSTTVRMHGFDLSVIDEWQYLGYLFGLPGHPIVFRGDLVGVEANELFSCYGAGPFPSVGSPCGGDYTDWNAYPQAGLNSADGYTPLYFWITWLVGKAIQTVTGTNFVIAMRLTGLFWLLPTLWVSYAAMVRMRTPRYFALAIVLLFTVMPFSWWAYTYVSTDAAVPLMGALALLVVVRHATGRGSLWWLLPIGLVGGALKITAIFAPMFAVVALFIHWAAGAWLRSRPRTPASPRSFGRRMAFWPTAIPAIAGMLGFVAVTFGWIVARGLMAVGPAAEQGITLPPERYLGSFLDTIPGMLGNFVGMGTDVYRVAPWVVAVMSWLFVGGVVGAAIRRHPSVAAQSLAWTTGIAALAFLPLLFVLTVVQGVPFALPARYCAALAPMALMSLALLADARSGRIAVTGIIGILVWNQLANAAVLA